MNYELNDKGVNNLIEAIYNRAATDLMEAYISGKENRSKPIERFFRQNPYGLGTDVGPYIIAKCKAEVKMAEDVVTEFRYSDREKMLLAESSVSKKAVQMYLAAHKENIKVETPKNEVNIYFLVRKENKNG